MKQIIILVWVVIALGVVFTATNAGAQAANTENMSCTQVAELASEQQGWGAYQSAYDSCMAQRGQSGSGGAASSEYNYYQSY